jgi:hypothetical protein
MDIRVAGHPPAPACVEPLRALDGSRCRRGKFDFKRTIGRSHLIVKLLFIRSFCGCERPWGLAAIAAPLLSECATGRAAGNLYGVAEARCGSASSRQAISAGAKCGGLPALTFCLFGQFSPLTGEIEEALLCARIAGFASLFLSFFGASMILFGSCHGRSRRLASGAPRKYQ